jgi:hypothetical protein
MHSSTPPGPPQELIDTLRPPPPADHNTIRADLSELASVSRLEDDSALMEASGSASILLERPKRRSALLAAGAAFGLALAALVLLRAMGPEPDTVVSTPLPAEPARPVAETPRIATRTAPAKSADAPATVELTLSAEPPSATLYLDGTPLPSNPYVGRLPADGELHLIRASAPGKQSQERVLALDRDRELQFDLAPRAAPAHARPRAAAPALSPAEAPASRAAAGPPVPAESAPHADPASRRDMDFDTRITPNAAPRDIYVEDPY